MKFFILLVSLLFSINSFAYKSVYVSGNGYDSQYCAKNAGYFCLENIKRRAQSEAEREARWSCEVNYRGRSLTYSSSFYTSCNPASLPSNHEATWVSCRAEARMECVLEN